MFDGGYHSSAAVLWCGMHSGMRLEQPPCAAHALAQRGDSVVMAHLLTGASSVAQVAEVTAQNEYQLKLRDLALNEKVRELTDKAAAEAAAAAERCAVAGLGVEGIDDVCGGCPMRPLHSSRSRSQPCTLRATPTPNLPALLQLQCTAGGPR